MAIYFSDRKLLKEFSTLSANERNRIDWRIFEEWRDIDEGTVSRCGVEGTCTVEKASGITEKAMSTLKDIVGATLGLKDILALKQDVEHSIGREINWQVSQKSTKVFRVQPPKCGYSALTVYQLFRVYEVTCLRKKWFTLSDERWAKFATRIFEERTNNHDAIPDTVESDPICKCPDSRPKSTFDGFMQLVFGPIGMRVPYRLTRGGFELQIDRHTVSIATSDVSVLLRGLDVGLDVVADTSLIPAPLRFLGNFRENENLHGWMTRYADGAEDRISDRALFSAAEFPTLVVAPNQLRSGGG